MLEQLDQSGARVEDQMGAEVLRHPLSLGQKVQQSLRVESREVKHAARLEEVLDARQRVVRVGMVLEDMEEGDGVEERAGVDEVRDRRAIDLQPFRARGACHRL